MCRRALICSYLPRRRSRKLTWRMSRRCCMHNWANMDAMPSCHALQQNRGTSPPLKPRSHRTSASTRVGFTAVPKKKFCSIHEASDQSPIRAALPLRPTTRRELCPSHYIFKGLLQAGTLAVEPLIESRKNVWNLGSTIWHRTRQFCFPMHKSFDMLAG